MDARLAIGLLRVVAAGCVVTLLQFPAENCVAVDAKERQAELRDRIGPLLAEHCLDCHSGDEPDAGLTLDHFDKPLDFLKGRGIWEKAVQRISLNEMPPPDSSDLSDEDRKVLVDWITETIDDYECGLTPNPGQVTLRRLNQAEYQNTIRDLFRVKAYSPATTFAGDDVGYGFDNIGDVLTLPPLLMEKYFLEAERITDVLIQTPPPDKKREWSFAGGQLRTEANSSNANRELTLASNGTASFQEQIPWAGTYSLTVTAGGNQAGNEPCLMEVQVDGKTVRKVRVPNDAEEPVEYVIPLRLRARNHTIGLSFTNDFYQAAAGGRPQLDRNLVIHHVLLAGTQPGKKKLRPDELSPSHKMIVFDTPKDDADRERATRAVLQRWASFAFRRPVSEDDLQRLVALALEVQDDGDSFEHSIQIGLQAILISPKFLFRVEPPNPGLSMDTYQELDEFELATRMSYFLWSSMPDPELLALATRNELRKGNNIEKQIARMIKDDRASQFVRNFAGQWLTLRNLTDFKPDPNVFPDWNDRIRVLAEFETLKFFAEVMNRNMSVLKLLDADFTFINEELAEYYGIPGVVGEDFRAVSLKGTPRAGLLTQASVLAVTSNPTRTSPVKRGKWVLENLLATPPPPAPAGVPELEEKKKGELTGTLRERLEQHRADPACANCHKLMDPIGFALENFDAIGQYRKRDGSLAIDASGEMPDGTKVTGAAELQKVLIAKHRDQFVECLSEKMLTYALGRGLEYYDKCAVDQIVQRLERENFRFSALLVGIVRSDPFQKKGQRDYN